MIPTLAIREKMAQLLAADTATLAQAANANKMALVMNDLAPSEGTVLSDLTLATFDGNTPIDVGLNTQPEALDPVTSDAIIDFKPPVTGFRWETTGVTNLPQTIYGYALVDNGITTLLACERFDTPITLTATNQRIDIGAPNLRQRANSVS
jgi:hypothetical protein